MDIPIKEVKTKKISKSIKKSVSEYVNFFKSYYKKLHSEHPKWNEKQVTVIIKLLWRKKKSIMIKNISRSVIPRLRAYKAISGRTLFGDIKRKETPMDADEIKGQWNTFPRETKKYWA